MSVTTTVDQLLLEVARQLSSPCDNVPIKDRRILLSLSKQLLQGKFLTENQANLLVKIFNENLDFVSSVNNVAADIINLNVWSTKFRIIERIRKISIDRSGDPRIKVEFTYDKRLRSKLSSMSEQIQGSISVCNQREFYLVLTEKNILVVLSEFRRDHFTIDENLLNFYHEIRNIIKTQSNMYDVFSLTDEKFKKIITDRVGEISVNNLLALHDKKIKYGYKVFEQIPEKTLPSLIAQRNYQKIFIDRNQVELTEIVNSVTQLKRFPILAIFDGHDPVADKNMLEMLLNSVKSNNLTSNFGIYFRYDKSEDTCGFNSYINENALNTVLDETTAIVGIANNKIPKFMIKSNWRPECIISFTNNFRTNKSSVYFSDVDLVIFYNTKQPLHGTINAIM